MPHPDVPDLPFEKPREIEELETMDRVVLDSMPSVEVEEKVEEIAHAVAKAYKESTSFGTYEECVDIVSSALNVTGSSIGGQVGLAMIAENNSAAATACRLIFMKEE